MAARWSIWGGSKKNQVAPINNGDLQGHIDKKFESLSKDMQSLREEVERLTKVNSELKDVVPSLKDMGLKVEEMNKTFSEVAARPPQLRLTQDNVRKHTDSQEKEALEKSGGLFSNLPSQYELEERAMNAVEDRFEEYYDAMGAPPTARDEEGDIKNKLYQQFTAGNALFVCEQLNEVAGDIPVVGTIIGALTIIFEKVEAAEANKEACEGLGMRVFELSCSLKDLLTPPADFNTLNPSLRKLKNKLTEAAEFIETFSSRGWLSKMFRSGSDASKFDAFEESLSKILDDAQFAVMGRVALKQAKHYRATQDIGNDVKELMATIETLGGIKSLVKDANKCKELASTLGVTVEEIQGEACDAATEELERTTSSNTMMSSSVVKHRGLRVFWQARLASKYKVSTDDFKEAMETHMSTDLGLDAELVKEFMSEHKWSKIMGLLDADEDGYVTIGEMRKTFNIISAKSVKDQDLVSGLRALIRYYDKKKNSKMHLKVNMTGAGGKRKKRAFFGRSEEGAALKKALLSVVQNDFFHAVEVFGGDGVGKTAFVHNVADLPAVQNHFEAGIVYVNLENFGSELQRCVMTGEEVATAVLMGLNNDIVEYDDESFDTRQHLKRLITDVTTCGKGSLVKVSTDPTPASTLSSGPPTQDSLNQGFSDNRVQESNPAKPPTTRSQDHRKSRALRRLLLIIDGIDADSTPEVLHELASLAAMPLVSAILVTSEPLQHPELMISTRIHVEPLSIRNAEKLVHFVNPQLSRKVRMDVISMGKGNPDTLIALAKMPKTQFEELKMKRRESTVEFPSGPMSTTSSCSPVRSYNNGVSPAHAYMNEPSAFSNAESLEEALSKKGTEESEVLKQMLKRGASEDSAIKSTGTGEDRSPRLGNAVKLVIDVDTFRQNALQLGFAVDDLSPPNLEKAKTDPGNRMPQSKVRMPRNGSFRRVSLDQGVSAPKTDVPKAGIITGGGLTTLTPSSRTGSAHRRVSVLESFLDENEDFMQIMMKPLTGQQLDVLRMLSLVPSSFNMEYMGFCFERTLVKHKDTIFSTAEELFLSFQNKGFLDVAGRDCDRFFVKKVWKRVVLRGLVSAGAGSEIEHVKEAFSSYYLDLAVKLSDIFRENDSKSWAREEVLMKMSDDRDNFVSVLKEADSTKAKEVFDSARELLAICLKKKVLKGILEAQGRSTGES
mmetsp:Transcript_7963/g.15868  ORF Transcript_7963/g.15868 Transcript_7963/m.15868 type:complete len:1179 (+) Transcript_7963:226-3762(+)|eukprot:CAMPEP_0182460694 /NCGR_PEP_ID=MMETSP1319-20130603/5488_1 /TAXON_ID=172717 /ORGANISM="Bolidomonas pacifica, Strain RCC208" /LENGTH=1178 /DNA_ID=CAMNT_0024659835 /DNA_START=212 /DNA_END=3748 /DNA_ORIENTATION=+